MAICFKDSCFCTFYEKCKKGKECDRALTPKVLEDAEKWMKNAPICQFVDKPECFEENDK